MSDDAVHRRRRRVVAGALVGVLAVGGLGGAWALGAFDGDEPGDGSSSAGPAPAGDPATATGEGSGTDEAGTGTEPTGSEDGQTQDGGTQDPAEETTAPAVTTAPPGIVAAQSRMKRVDYLTGGLTPKSVVASGAGLVIANNMMYSHTSTVFDSRTREVVATLDDGIEASEFGLEGHPGTSRGAPVEAAWTDDGRYAYVSQYTMYGEGFGREGFDACTPADGVGASLLYRFDAEEMAWDQVIEVGAVPKFVDITPDQTRALVSNWCDSTLSVVDLEQAEEVAVIPIAAAPRGIEVLPDNRTAYVAAMYADTLYKVDLQEGTSEVAMQTGDKPRHLNLSPDGRHLFMAVSGADTVYKIDTETDEIVDEVVTGREPRSMTLSSDGTALYVVNYYEPSVAKVSTQDMEVLQKEPTDATPIGVTYDPVTHMVWVACYGGSIYVFDDQVAAE